MQVAVWAGETRMDFHTVINGQSAGCWEREGGKGEKGEARVPN